MNEPELFFQWQIGKTTNNKNLKYVVKKLPFVQNLKKYTQILWLAQFLWRTLYLKKILSPETRVREAEKTVYCNMAKLDALRYSGIPEYI
jgi:hypothetical protein